MYGQQLAGWRSGVPPMNMMGLGFSWADPKVATLMRKPVWSREDWANAFGSPLAYYQSPGFAKDYSAIRNPIPAPSGSYSRSPTAAQRKARDMYTAWGKIKPTLRKEYLAHKEKLDAVKAAIDAQEKAETLKIEEAAKQQELETQIKTAEGSAETQIQTVLRQWEQQEAGPAAGGGKILGMNKKTAMIAGGVAAVGITALILAT